MFILFDSQYNVGDIIEVDGFRGVVTDIGIRTTSITDASENVKIVNNADMRNILNRSDHVSKSFCDISIPYTCDLEALEEKFPSLLEEIRQKRADVMLDTPVYLGVQQLADSAVVLRFCVDVKEKDIYGGARILNRDLLLGLRQLGVECPLPPAGRPLYVSHGRAESAERAADGAERTAKGMETSPGVHPALGAWRPGGAPPRGGGGPRFPRSFRARRQGCAPESGAPAGLADTGLRRHGPSVDSSGRRPAAAELPSPEPPTSAGDPLPTVPPETTPPGGEESPGPVQTPEPITFFSAMMNGSEGFLQVVFPEPETIASAKVTQFDTITQRPFYEDTFGEGIPRADIDAGLYTAFYVVYPPDFDDYWAEAGADTYPTFEMRLTVEQVNGETETYTAVDLGRCPQLRGEYDETTNTVTMKVWWDDGEDFPQVVPVAPEQAEGDTLSVTVYVDGEPLPPEAYALSQVREESQYSTSDNPDVLLTRYTYITVATASLPQPLAAESALSCAVHMTLSGQPFTYSPAYQHCPEGHLLVSFYDE